MNEQFRLSRRFRVVVLALLALLLVWQIITRSFGVYLAETAPEAAISLRGADPAALLNLADESLDAALSARGAKLAGETAPDKAGPQNDADAEADEQIRAWAELALRSDPLNARALRILGQLADSRADEARASKLMAAAARCSLHESRAFYWLMQKSLQRNDFASAAYYADVLLRTSPQVVERLTPALAWMAERKGARGEIEKLLASNPPWRAQFFEHLPSSISDARTPLELFLSLSDAHNSPTAAELQSYLNFLIRRKLYELAYNAWLQFLTPDQLSHVGSLFNGDFESTPSGLPFDWAIASGPGVTVDIERLPDREDKRALFIEFGYGRVDFRPITQLVLLAPGAYRLEGAYKGEIIGRRGLRWGVTCADGAPAPIGRSPMVTGAANAWKSFDFEFTVPAKDCRAQYVSLALDARSASEQMVSGSIWYSDLRIERVAGNNGAP